LIIARYLSKQLLLTTFAITVILVLIVMSSRFAQYAERAAEGKVAVDIIVPALVFALPQMLELIIPLSFFLAILVAYGHLYENSEMTVLRACGVSRNRLMRVTLMNALFMAVVVGVFSFFVTPKGKIALEQVIADQGLQTELGSATPGRFYDLSGQRGAVHAEEFSEDRSEMRGVFIRQRQLESDFNYYTENVIWAERGLVKLNPNGSYYFVLENGVNYRGSPGFPEFEITRFQQLGQRLDSPAPIVDIESSEELYFWSQLVSFETDAAIAEFNWRLSMPVLIFVVSVIALPLSQTDARSGRFARIIPAILLYLLYLVTLNAGKGSVQNGDLSAFLGIWSIHLVFLVIGLGLLFMEDLTRWRRSRA
jgi:lipopolysaccharide export system permease protein